MYIDRTSTPGTILNDALGHYGFRGGHIGAQLDRRIGQLGGTRANLRDAAREDAYGRATTGIERAMGRGPSLFTASPMQARERFWAGRGPGAARSFDLAGGQAGLRGARLERLIQTDPALRRALEQKLGGRIVSYGAPDGRIRVMRSLPQRSTRGGTFSASAPGVSTHAMSTVGGMFANMDNQIADAVRQLGLSQLGGAGGGAMLPMLGGLGAAAGGQAGPQSPVSAEIDSLMNDPSMTVEDKITMLLMLLMKKSDKDIEAQGKRLAALQQQQQQNTQGTGGFGGLGGVGGIGGAGMAGLTNPDGSAPSVDMESMKLKRMVDRRSQMFDTLRSIIDRYNETAKNLIQSIGR